MKRVAIAAILALSLNADYNVTGTDYSNTITEQFTQEDSLSTLKMVNDILDFISQSRAESFVNKGAYIALVKDPSKSEGFASSKFNVETLYKIYLDVVRENSSSPMLSKFWYIDDKNNFAEVGYVKAYKGVSSEYPYGQFVMEGKGFGYSNGEINTSDIQNSFVLKVDNAADGYVKFEYKFTSSYSSTPLVLNMLYNPSTKKGEAYVKAYDYTSSSPKNYYLTFDSTSYKVQDLDNNQEVCKSKEDFFKAAFEYKLFNYSDGKAVNLRGGEVISFDDNGTTKYGYVGYWGIWPESVVGKSVNIQGDNTSYIVKATQGKLIAHRKNSISMSKLSGAYMYIKTWLGSDMTSAGEYIITWNSNTENFDLLGKMECTPYCTLQEVNATYSDLNISATSNFMAWIPALRSEINLLQTYTNDTNVVYYEHTSYLPESNETFVNFGTEIINPDMNSTAGTETITLSQNANIIGRRYQYDVNRDVLLDLNYTTPKPVVISADANYTLYHPDWEWGANMGPLLKLGATESYSNPNEYNISNYYEVTQKAEVYYTWETGKNMWNKLYYLVDSSGNKVTFKEPLTLYYNHSTSNDLNNLSAHNGQFYILRYDGMSLDIPFEYNSTFSTYIPEINLKAGSVVTDANNNQYVVKPTLVALYPQLSNSCDYNAQFDLNETISVDINTSAIGASGIVNPSSIPEGAKVKVIKGEIQ